MFSSDQALNDSEMFVEGPCDAQYELQFRNGVNDDCESKVWGRGEGDDAVQVAMMA